MSYSKTHLTRREVLLAAVSGSLAAACAQTTLQKAFDPWPPMELILCGAEEVFILRFRRLDENPHPQKVWSWCATDSPEIPESLKRAFRSTDDCKPVEGGKKILISSSSGAVALIDRESKRALFHAPVVNAHSIEMLPGGLIAAAASVSESPAGNRLILFDAASGKELTSDALYAAHGAVWNEQRGLLWALGGSELRAYKVEKEKGKEITLKCEFQKELPEGGGHDLSPIPGTPLLFVSANRHCWYFNRDTREFKPHNVLADAVSIKCYSVHQSGRVAYVQAEGGNFWSERVRLLHPEGVLHLPGQRLYKARWK